MAEFNWTVDDIKRAQRDFSNNFMRLDCIRTESYDVAIDCMTECIEKKASDVQPVDRWISVKDRLPEEQQCILAYEKDYGVMWGDYQGIKYSQPVWIVRKQGLIIRTTEVTHWQPLPEPPKEG